MLPLPAMDPIVGASRVAEKSTIPVLPLLMAALPPVALSTNSSRPLLVIVASFADVGCDAPIGELLTLRNVTVPVLTMVALPAFETSVTIIVPLLVMFALPAVLKGPNVREPSLIIVEFPPDEIFEVSTNPPIAIWPNDRLPPDSLVICALPAEEASRNCNVAPLALLISAWPAVLD